MSVSNTHYCIVNTSAHLRFLSDCKNDRPQRIVGYDVTNISRSMREFHLDDLQMSVDYLCTVTLTRFFNTGTSFFISISLLFFNLYSSIDLSGNCPFTS